MNSSKSITKKKSDLPSLSEESLHTICDQLHEGLTLTEILKKEVNGKPLYPVTLMKFYAILKKNPEMEANILEARKNGIQTLIDKLLQVFMTQEIDNPNIILWVRERTKFVTFLASKLTDIYSDNKPQQIRSDQNINISFSSGMDDREVLDLDPKQFEVTQDLNSTNKETD